MTLRFADISIPHATARSLAIKLDKRTASDEHYVVKSGIAAAFGFDAIRPWRLLSKSDGVYRVVGVLRDDATLKPTADSRRLGIVTEIISYEPGDTLDLVIAATPVKRVTFRDRETRERIKSVFMDITVRKDLETGVFTKAQGIDLKHGYMQWLVETLSDEERTGMRVIDEPRIVSTRGREMLRKRHGTPLLTWTSCVDAQVRVMITDRAVFYDFLKQGLKKMKDLGLGAMIPVEVIEGLAA